MTKQKNNNRLFKPVTQTILLLHTKFFLFCNFACINVVLRMHVFYSPDSDNGIFTLPREESYHCLKVLRFRRGQTIVVTNGKGILLEGLIEDENIQGVRISAIRLLSQFSKRPFDLHIAMSPLKNVSRFEWFIEKATEFRTAEITPIICQRTERRNFRTDRMQKIAIEAMKQSVSEFCCNINEPVYFNDFIQNSIAYTGKYIAACLSVDKIKVSQIEENSVVMLIGPEGDFTDEELQAAIQSGFVPVSFGMARLRSETAATFTSSVFYNKFFCT